MLLAIEGFVRFFEDLLTRSRLHKSEAPEGLAANDNDAMAEEDRLWAAYR